MSRTWARVLGALATGLTVAMLVSSCVDAGAERLEARERTQRLEKRIASTRTRLGELPKARPEQFGAYTNAMQRFNATRVEFGAKKNAGFGTISETAAERVETSLDILEDMLEQFPD